MKRGTGEEKVMGPMFPRLNVNDTEKGGPRAPPRNKMALYEQLSIPSQRYNPGDLPHNSSNSANLVLPHPSQENEHERGVLFSRQLPALRHPVEKPYGRSSGSNTPLREVKSKRQTEKEDFRVPTFDNSKERAVNTEDYSKGTSDIDKRDSTLKRTDQLSHVTPRENLVNTFGESHKTNIVQLEFRSDCQVDCTVFSGSVIDVDNDSQEDKTCKSSQTGEMAHSDELSETSMVEYVSEMDISPDNVVRMIGQKHFWKARRAIANQQRTLALQVFELHRLLKVQKLIAGSPNLNLEDNAYLGKPLKRLSAKRVCLEHSVKAPEIVSRPKNDSEKPKGRMECNAENDVGKTSLSSVRQPSSCNPLSEKQLPTPVKHDSLMSPWYFNQPPGHQWLIPMMSPSEGLVYKPHSGPAVMSPVYGGCGPPGSTPMTGNFLASAYGLPFAPPTGHGYFRPFGMPVTNPAIPSPTQNQSNQVVASHSKGQLSGGRASFNIQHPNSSNVGSESDGTLPEVVRLYPSRDSELHASTAGSPSEIQNLIRNLFFLLPNSLIHNFILKKSMAASVENRQYTHLEPGLSGVGRTFKPRPDSPVRGCNFPPSSNHELPFQKKQNPPIYLDYSSSEDEDDDDEKNEYVQMIKKGKTELEPSIHDTRDEGTADNWIERNFSLIRLTGKHPFNSEPPLSRLMHHGFITPVPLHYVRNHGPVPKASWSDWTVEVTGLVKRPMKFTMDQLVNEFPSRELPVTLVCAGNRRKEQNMVKQTIGFNWGAAAVSTTVWRGVPLRALLKRCGVQSKKKGALNVCFEGSDVLPGGGGSKYGTSIKKEFAMDPSRDIIVAYMQNGEMLSPDHGFPVRMIIPGFIGGRMVKWLKRIVVTTQESESYYHYKDNRVLPPHVDAELANAEAWWYKPEYIINELNINSVITTPCHEEILPINAWTTQRPYTLRGYAYSGGGKKVTRVEVTLDGGETWSVCTLDHPEKPTKYGKYWCWCFWSLEVEVLDLLSAKEIAVRATDETLNTQPEKLIWNVMGMMNNCWFRVKMNVCKPHKGEIGIVFEHPTQPGNQSGGWMAKERHLEISAVAPPTLKKSISTPFMNTASKMYSMSEVRKHNSSDSAWIIVHGHIYDASRFLKDHPGGVDSILINAGTDCTEEFDAIHSDKAKKLLEDFRIGELITTGYTSDSSPNSSVHGSSSISSFLAPIKELVQTPTRSVALIPREKIPCKLVDKQSISHDVRKFKFALPSEDQVLGLPVGKHIFLCATVDDKLCMRAYTPTSTVDEVGFFELVVKIYFKGVHPKFPNGGQMSQHLDSLPIGAFLDVKGPLGHIEYQGKGNFLVHGKQKFAKKLAMIAGGTGITPVYQVMQSILKDPEDDTEMYVVYANRTEDDILLKDELDAWAEQVPNRVKVWYVVQESITQGWKYSTGFVTESILREHIPEPSHTTLALACGPPPMIQFAINPNLEKMGYDIKEELLVF